MYIYHFTSGKGWITKLMMLGFLIFHSERKKLDPYPSL